MAEYAGGTFERPSGKVLCVYCGLWVDIEDGQNLVRMDEDGWLMAAHPQCLERAKWLPEQYDGDQRG